MARIPFPALALLLCGCATGTGAELRSESAAAADLPALAVTVAAQLEDAALGDPARLALVELELRRISDALPLIPAPAAAAAAPGAIPQSDSGAGAGAGMRPAPNPADSQPTADDAAYPAAPELAGARSLFSALTLGAYPSADTARAAWFGMNAAHGEALAGLDARIETAPREDGTTTFILKAGPFASAAEAETVCARMRQAGAVCSAGDFTGDRL